MANVAPATTNTVTLACFSAATNAGMKIKKANGELTGTLAADTFTIDSFGKVPPGHAKSTGRIAAARSNGTMASAPEGACRVLRAEAADFSAVDATPVRMLDGDWATYYPRGGRSHTLQTAYIELAATARRGILIRGSRGSGYGTVLGAGCGHIGGPDLPALWLASRHRPAPAIRTSWPRPGSGSTSPAAWRRLP